MTNNFTDGRPAEELEPVAQRMRDERPQLTALASDQLKQRIRRTSSVRPQTGRGFMRTRLAIVSMLVMGVLMSGAGAGLAVTGLSGSGSAGTAQYGPPAAPGVSPTQGVLGTSVEGGTDTTPQGTANAPSEGVQGVDAQNNGPSNRVAGVQASRQVQTDDSNDLPFTGYAAIPVLLIGIALLLTGAVMRRRVQTDAGLR